MDFYREFPYPTAKDFEVIKCYLDAEVEFMPKANFYNDDQNILIRRNAVSMIAKLTTKEFMDWFDPDAYVPYIAMNYFDRFVSHFGMKYVEGQTMTEKVNLIAISCFTISAKMRVDSFEYCCWFLQRVMKNLGIKSVMVMKTELVILQALKWRMKPVTPDCFLNSYYPCFKDFGGFNRRSINEIIVQAQGEHTFVDFMPSQIALSALLAASKLAYPLHKEKIERIKSNDKVKDCAKKMIDLCRRMNIRIDTPGSLQMIDGTVVDMKKLDIGKMKTSQLQVQEEPEKLYDKTPKKPLNFELKWVQPQ
ncbi:cyclin-d3-3-like protein [Trifolium pratense]|uniref:B-like cyclin n=1 Tax=Trifolium pratense TaxID=57577 RepID=A0A2K3NMX6_TRIPR|nr:cyclin-d3-3-like protein [Trifolium pratense]